MPTVEYRVLAYASSEHVSAGTDIIIVLKVDAGVGPRLRAWLVDNWKTVTSGADDDTIDYIESVFLTVSVSIW